ncbi:TPA: hypothetical protein DDW35_09470, partial [Candidatus Sumerlaeota bacterium]|nr:hypothetical protein [Candidatus Sumerlaeota bacterium]
PVSNREQLLAKIQEYHDFEIGTIRVDEIDLVIHDCYHRRKEEIQKFVLGALQNKIAEVCCQPAE